MSSKLWAVVRHGHEWTDVLATFEDRADAEALCTTTPGETGRNLQAVELRCYPSGERTLRYRKLYTATVKVFVEDGHIGKPTVTVETGDLLDGDTVLDKGWQNPVPQASDDRGHGSDDVTTAWALAFSSDEAEALALARAEEVAKWAKDVRTKT